MSRFKSAMLHLYAEPAPLSANAAGSRSTAGSGSTTFLTGWPLCEYRPLGDGGRSRRPAEVTPRPSRRRALRRPVRGKQQTPTLFAAIVAAPLNLFEEPPRRARGSTSRPSSAPDASGFWTAASGFRVPDPARHSWRRRCLTPRSHSRNRLRSPSPPRCARSGRLPNVARPFCFPKPTLLRD